MPAVRAAHTPFDHPQFGSRHLNMHGVFFKNTRTGTIDHSKGQKSQVSAQSCTLTRQKLRFSSDKLRFTPDGTTTLKFRGDYHGNIGKIPNLVWTAGRL